MYRHNNVLKCLYFALLQQFGIIKTIPPPNSGVEPKPATKTNDVQILWDIPIYSSGAEMLTTVEQGNRPDMVVIDLKSKTVTVIECSCPWVTNMDRKDKEKTDKYQEARAELQRRYHGFHIHQMNVLLDVMGRYGASLKSSLGALLGQNRLAERVLSSMQKAAVLSSIRIKDLFKAFRF